MNAIREYFNSIGLQPAIRPSLGGCPEPTCINGFYYGPTGRTVKKFDGTVDEVWEVQPCPRCAERVCPTCLGKGVVQPAVPQGHPDFGKFFPCPDKCPSERAMSEERREKLRRRAFVPRGYGDCTFESFENHSEEELVGKAQAYYAARLFVMARKHGYYVNRAQVAAEFEEEVEDDLRNWLVFYGPNGRGKTGLAVAIMNALLAAQTPVMYVRLQDWIEAMKRRYNNERAREGFDDPFADYRDAGDVMEMVRTAPVLIVDEFDFPNKTEHSDSIVWQLINHRYEQALPTVLTTNLDTDGMEEAWGLMVSTRIGQRAHWIPMTGESLRATPAAFNWE